MAYRYNSIFKGLSVSIYNLDWAVGDCHAQNHRDDVMLAQTLLRILYWDIPAAPGYIALEGKFRLFSQSAGLGNAPLAVDGRHGPITRAHITLFQQQLPAYLIADQRGVYKSFIAQDQRLDPFRAIAVTASDHIFAFSCLTEVCYSASKSLRENFYDDLATNAPAPLHSALAKSVKRTPHQYSHQALQPASVS